MKRVLTIQDISCIGKCSLTAALPVLSAMGLETAVLPTALLSTHTEFKGVYKKDLTEILEPIADHWKEQKLTFASVSCGYLGSVRQIELVKKIFRESKKEGAVTIVDPVMGDYGKLYSYSGFDADYISQMRSLCREAQVLLPNLTEAAYLLGLAYSSLPTDRKGYEALGIRLSEYSGGSVVLKGIPLTKGKIAVLICDAHTKESVFCEREYLDARFSGTGDIFAAVCQGALAQGSSLREAAELAMDFILECIRKTLADADHRWYGVNLEEALPFLIRKQGR